MSKTVKIIGVLVVIALVAGAGLYFGGGEGGQGSIRKIKSTRSDSTEEAESESVSEPPSLTTSMPVAGSSATGCGDGKWKAIFKSVSDSVVGDFSALVKSQNDGCDFKLVIHTYKDDGRSISSSFECAESRVVKGDSVVGRAQKFYCSSPISLVSSDVQESADAIHHARGGSYLGGQNFMLINSDDDHISSVLHTYRYFGDDRDYENFIRQDIDPSKIIILSRR